MAHQNINPLNWDKIDLVVFDVDGTLYDQRPLRMRMARDMLLHTLSDRNLNVISVVKTYRRIRERLGEEEVVNFDTQLIEQTATSTNNSEATVLAIINDWIEHRPLPYLMACRYPRLNELFAGLKRNGKKIGVFSDYPAREKLAALGLSADFIVSAQDNGIRRLKPHPLGLEFLMQQAGATPETTLMIGDRIERDGLAAYRAKTHCLIRSAKPIQGWQTFARFDNLLFAPLLST